MDLLRLVLARQDLDKVFPLRRLYRSREFLRVRSLVLTHLPFEGDYWEYTRTTTIYGDLSKLSPLFVPQQELMIEAIFQRNIGLFHYYADLHPRMVPFWHALRSGIPEIQAKVLALLSEDPKEPTPGADDFDGNVLFSSNIPLCDIPWTAALRKEIKDYAERTKIFVGGDSAPKTEEDGSVEIGISSGSESDGDEDIDLTDQYFIEGTANDCAFLDINLRGIRGSDVIGSLLKVTNDDDIVTSVPEIDNADDVIPFIQEIVAGYLPRVLGFMFGDPNINWFEAAIEFARAPVILQFNDTYQPPHRKRPNSYLGAKLACRMLQFIIVYGNARPSIAEYYKSILAKSKSLYKSRFFKLPGEVLPKRIGDEQEDVTEIIYAERIETTVSLIEVFPYLPKPAVIGYLPSGIRYGSHRTPYQHLLSLELIEKMGNLFPDRLKCYRDRAAYFRNRYQEILARLQQP